MKIYNKKMFASGVFMVALGIFNLVTNMIRKDVDVTAIILIVALFAFGFGSIVRSLSKKMTKKDILADLDERNRLIQLKSKSKSFQIMHTISFALMVILMVMGKVSVNKEFIAMGIGVAFAFVISMFTEIFTYMYYDSKN